MKKNSAELGCIVKIDLSKGSFSFGQALKKPLFAFYDKVYHDMPSIESVCSERIAFAVWVRADAVSSGLWQIVGSLPVEPELATIQRFFKQDPISKKFYIYADGKDVPASREECVGLERAAVWDPKQVEERLQSHFLGVPSKNFAAMRLPDR